MDTKVEITDFGTAVLTGTAHRQALFRSEMSVSDGDRERRRALTFPETVAASRGHLHA
jgi:hypothetical protein